MNRHSPDQIRNIAFVGHSGTGKTSLSEAMLFLAGKTNRLGSVDDGSTTSDFTESEKERQISISASMLQCEWQGTKVNAVDAPGYADFIGDAKAAIWAVDAAVIVVHGQQGVEIGTDKAWGFCEGYGRSAVFFVNHIDKEQADFDSALSGIQEHFGQGVAPVQIPVNQGVGFNQIVDVLKNKLVTYQTDGSGKSEVSDVPPDLEDQIATMR